MFLFIVRRIVQTIPVLIGVTLAVFLMMYLIPGDAARIIAGENANPEQIEQMRENLGLNDPPHQQYLRFVSNAVTGDLGNSIRTNRPVAQEIFDSRFWITAQLAILGTALAVVFGLIAGIISATRKYSFSDVGLMLIALFGLSMPNFWLGIMLIYVFSVHFGVLPVAGWGTWQQMVLPTITLGTVGAAIIARMTRSAMLEVLDQDYIRTSHAKGVSEKVVIYKHALRNALIPVVTVVGLQFGSLLGGAVVTEQVFAINGLGRLIVDSIRAHDFPMVQGAILVCALLFVFVNLAVDISYRFLNKRVDLS
ncbi:glutathione ABC transporter permease [Alkalihalobacillus alcalophilus ATCC 27647 = CGMCC 1.3604]|uniref:Dipeptide/oligopeptide transporter n=1 Tax=Alkalihalobacillus alcalophilus ATCC 27647 = CGMCC 1.3604 TaxID=1218173 RepID=J8TF95_ALKAL|nr:ABC transporter permease [Alkalihalobacillus alcalophilus]AFV25649.1 dipeptide/oligopeptide transporter [Alkalihalobacillus alcalophilus ATCC 27647 = CGMCC 1.3604]KGA96605.1 peptide ABC transporter permease [Alkalihalobacillus alcalophilus ATCC 27647 = CGMCC 1.3604]MED1561704.1 ABC transporter permease [Alkalihalobacillus alcalophilus]THG92252.1 glutathione ABC transporter permease [Alkalihalobacillus alcalophilus ATCC 27647 = CGMCC 1.3604]